MKTNALSHSFGTGPTENLTNAKSVQERLIELISPLVAPLGYEIVHLEIQSQRQKVLRIYLDLLEPGTDRRIGIEDCAKVSRSLDGPLEALPEINEIFRGSYELEVSSPGVDRPLRQAKDYERFSGHEIRIHVYRPLTAEEIGNEDYHLKNPKQKNFVGVLKGLQKDPEKNDRVVLSLSGSKNEPKKSAKGQKALTEEVRVTIPLPLISKANLEPKFEDFQQMKERVK